MKQLFRVFFLLALLASSTDSKAQAFNFSITPYNACYNTSGPNTATIDVVAPGGGAGSWSFVVTSPVCGDAATTNIIPTGSQVSVSFTCCGLYTVVGQAFANTNSTIPIPGATVIYTYNLVCPNAATIVPSTISNTVCTQTAMNLGAQGMTTFTWTSSLPGGTTPTVGLNPLAITPVQNATYTVIGETVIPTGFFTTATCVVSNTLPIYVQSATLSAGPPSQTLCVGSPLCFTTAAGSQTGANFTTGTTTTSIGWTDPLGGAVPQCTSPASQGIYTAALVHNGAAGSCTVFQTAQVFTTNTIPVTLSASHASICPGGTVQLFSSSQQTSAISGHTWTASFGPPIVNSGSTILQGIPTPSATYTVDVLYFGCPGQATITIGLKTLTPNLVSTPPAVCPGTSLNLTASGGVDYTITATDLSLNAATILTTTGVSSVVHTPTAPGFPWQYAVSAYSAGCVGTHTITVGEYTIVPFLTSSPANSSVCPNTNFTLNSTGGAGTNYTFYTLPAPGTVLQTGPTNFLIQTAPSLPFSYSVSVDSAGCKGGDTHTINLMSLNPVVALSSPSVCEGRTVTMTSSGGANTSFTFYAPTFATPVTGTVVPKPTVFTPSATHTPIFSLPQITTYTVMADSAGCVGSSTFSVGILNLSPNLNLSIRSGTNTVINACPNSALTLSANVGLVSTNYTYTFTLPPSVVGPNGTTKTYNFTAPSSTNSFPATYTVEVDSAGCKGSTTTTLALRVLNPGLTANAASVCAGTSVQISANPGRALTFHTFIGLGAIPTNSTVQGPGTPTFAVFNPTETTTYYVYVDSAGCTNAAAPIQSVVVGMNSTLNIGAQVSPSIICSGLPSTLSVVGNTAYTYTWTAPSGTNVISIGTGTTAVVNPTVSTVYTLIAMDVGGCKGSQTVALTVDPTASLSMVVSAPFNTICAASPSQGLPQQTNTMTASGAVNYSWTPATFLSTTTNSITITTPTTSVIYTVTGNNGLGCNGAAQFTMTVNQYANIIFNPPTSDVCPGFNATITAFGGQSYTWTSTTFTGGIAQQSISGGPGTYTVLVSNGGSCLNTKAITIGTLAPLTIGLSYANNTSTTCIMTNNPKKAKNITLNATGASNYIWQPYDPLTMTYSLGPTTDVRPHTSTCYTVTGSTQVCAGSSVICVTVAPQFTIEASPLFPAMCLGDSLKLSVTNIGLGAVGSPAAFSYSWSEAQNAPPISLSAYLSPTTMAFPQNTTTYSVDVTDTRTCVSAPRLITVTVLPQPITDVLLPIINNVPTNTVCFVGDSPGPSDVILNLTAANANPGLPFGIQSTYTWTSPNNSILSDPNDNPATVRAKSRLPAIVVYTVVSGYKGVNGCRVVDTVSVRIIDCRPVIAVSFTTAETNDTVCVRDCITFMNLTDTLAGGPQTFTWSFQGGNPSESNVANPTVCYNIPGAYNVILRVANPYPLSQGGSSAIKPEQKYITVVDVPNVTIVPPGQAASSQTIQFGASAVLTATGAFSYDWEPPYNISSTTGSVVTVNPLNTTQYVVWGYNSKNCKSSDTVNVHVIKDCGEMFVPNAFSPNGDKHNDELKVMGICLETMTFMVFNRWGEKIFESTDQSKGWDGTYKEKEVESGVYVYRLEGKTYDGEGFSSKGNVTLIR